MTQAQRLAEEESLAKAGDIPEVWAGAMQGDPELDAWLRAWEEKIETLGAIHYPQEAMERGITGSLVLAVEVSRDGQVRQAAISRPSGQKILDEAALRIVSLAAPFAPFPPDLAKRLPALRIKRVWRFVGSAGG